MYIRFNLKATKTPIQRQVDHLWVCSTDIHCLSLSTCSRMVSFYKMFVFLKCDVNHPSCNFHEILRKQVVGDGVDPCCMRIADMLVDENKRSLICFFCSSTRFVHFSIVIGVSRGWLKTSFTWAFTRSSHIH